MGLFEWIDTIDKAVFGAIQQHVTATWLDDAMLLLRHQATWIPIYLFMLIWILKRFRNQAIAFILLSLATFALCDFISASILKPMVGRLRPCYDTDVASLLRGLIGCGGRFSFPSSHATNHFGLATFWFLAIRQMNGKRWHWLWLWAGLVCFAQVYVGKHFPSDVLGGALLGMLIGLLTASVFKNWPPNWPKQQKSSNFVKNEH